jgi:hypothetical protein
VLQFVILKPILVFVTLVLYGSGLYEDGSFSARDGYLYITLVYTISYTGALAALVLFYVACKDLLRPFYPFSKFVIIKSVVFLTFWQVWRPPCLADNACCKWIVHINSKCHDIN